jgi:hypothetical protein
MEELIERSLVREQSMLPLLHSLARSLAGETAATRAWRGADDAKRRTVSISSCAWLQRGVWRPTHSHASRSCAPLCSSSGATSAASRGET